MSETKKIYQGEIQKYFEVIALQFEEILEKYIKYGYDDDVEYVEFVIYQGAFYEEYSIVAMMVYDDLGGDAMFDEFSDIRPLLNEDLDFYNIDYEYRGSVFMNEVGKLFCRAYRNIISSDEKNYPMTFYVQESNGHIRWCLNTGKISKTPIL